jgi:uncharacterized membrane protein
MSDTGAARPRGVSTLLLVSLCFNFFLAGIVFLGALRAIEHGQMPIPVRQFLMPHAVRLLLPENEQSKLDSVVAAHHDALAKDRKAVIDARDAAFRDYDAADFDAAKFAADLEKVRAADSILEEEALKTMAETAAKLTPQERRMVADHVRRELWRSRWKRG